MDGTLYFGDKAIPVSDIQFNGTYDIPDTTPITLNRSVTLQFDSVGMDPVAMARLGGVDIKVVCNKCSVECEQVRDSLSGTSAVYKCPECGTEERIAGERVAEHLRNREAR